MSGLSAQALIIAARNNDLFWRSGIIPLRKSARDMNTIGETMRRERVRQGLDLQAVSENTKIGTRMLKAMEAGDFGKLPGGVFTRSFVRQYATALGLDPAYVEAELTELNLQPEEKNSS